MGIRKMKEKKGREGASSCFPMSEEGGAGAGRNWDGSPVQSQSYTSS